MSENNIRVKPVKSCGAVCEIENAGICMGRCFNLSTPGDLSTEEKRRLSNARKELFRTDNLTSNIESRATIKTL